MRLYNVNTDTFLTDRAQIIDSLVQRAVELMTFGQRVPRRGGQREMARELLAIILSEQKRGDALPAGVLTSVVRMLWASTVLA